MSDDIGYISKLRGDMPEQFKRKKNIDAVLKAFARQFDDLYAAFCQLSVLRWLENAQGAQLDGIGDIVVLTRLQAAALESIRTGKSAGILDDETYRIWLRYKMFLNVFNGTYSDFMRNIRMFWEETVLYYSENPDSPATIFLDTPELEGRFDPVKLFNIPIIKPGGVQIIIRANTSTPVNLELLMGAFISARITQTTLPQLN